MFIKKLATTIVGISLTGMSLSASAMITQVVAMERNQNWQANNSPSNHVPATFQCKILGKNVILTQTSGPALAQNNKINVYGNNYYSLGYTCGKEFSNRIAVLSPANMDNFPTSCKAMLVKEKCPSKPIAANL